MRHLSLLWALTLLVFVNGRSTDDDFKCYRCELDTESKTPQKCKDVQLCTGARPVCAKLEFSAFFHGVMGTRTVKFCYDMSRRDAGRPLEDIDLCDVPHHDFHSAFSLETRSILATVCKNKHSTWHMSQSCTTPLCNGVSSASPSWIPILAGVLAVFVATWRTT